MSDEGRIRIGTSGWHYDHWRGPFYPSEMPAEGYLAHYAERFGTVEVNNTFYQLPDRSSVDGWRDTVGQGFRFAVKASRYITHMQKLSDPQEPVASFMDRVTRLEDRLGPILFQLPPNWHRDAERLRMFLEQLPSAYRYAFEFRDATWFGAPIYELLEKAGVAFCVYEMAGSLSPVEVTADFVYVRFHGPSEGYQGGYSDQSLWQWADRLKGWSESGHDVYAYFNNDAEGHAPRDAARLEAMLADA